MPTDRIPEIENALILGATSDIAIALAHLLSARGVNLLLAARNMNELGKTAGMLNKYSSSKVTLLPFNALEFEKHASFAQSLPYIPDVTICAFGYLGNQQKAETDTAEQKLIYDTNYAGAVSILNHIVKLYEQKGTGIIVGISSVAGDRIRQSNRYYGESKAAFSSYLYNLQQNLPAGIHTIIVKPGFVATKMTRHLKLPRFITATPNQVATTILSAIDYKMKEIYVLPVWRLIMFVIKIIPESIFKRLKM